MTFDWSTDSQWEFLSQLVAWFFWSIAETGLEWIEAGLGELPVSGPEGIVLALVIALGLFWIIVRLIKLLAFLGSLTMIAALAVRVVAF